MHNDEEHPHIHFYVYSDTEVNAKMLHGQLQKWEQPKGVQEGLRGFPKRVFRAGRQPVRACPHGASAAVSLACRVARGAENVDVDSEGGECGARFRRAEGEGGSQEPPSRTSAGGAASKKRSAKHSKQ